MVHSLTLTRWLMSLLILLCFYFMSEDAKPVPLSEVTPEFQSSMDGLRGYLADRLSTPHRFGGQDVLGGATLQPLMTNICESVSKGERIAPLRYSR